MEIVKTNVNSVHILYILCVSNFFACCVLCCFFFYSTLLSVFLSSKISFYYATWSCEKKEKSNNNIYYNIKNVTQRNCFIRCFLCLALCLFLRNRSNKRTITTAAKIISTKYSMEPACVHITVSRIPLSLILSTAIAIKTVWFSCSTSISFRFTL